MAQQTSSDPMHELDEYDSVACGEGRTMVWVPSGSGPAPDPVEVWLDHQDQYRVASSERTPDGTTCYLLVEVQG